MRRPPLGIPILLAVSAATLCVSTARGQWTADSWVVGGQVYAYGSATDAPESWRNGGFGRLDAGGTDAGSPGAGVAGSERAETAVGRADLTLEWRSTTTLGDYLGAYLHLAGRAESDALSGRDAGVVEAFVEADLPVRGSDRIHLVLGHFLLPTSRENVGPAWSSPYTLTFSALNSWIGEEVRATGFSGGYHLAVGAIDELSLTGTLFGGNDTSGTLLAWRGWAFSDRLSVAGEALPLPPALELADGGAFDEQTDEGTHPFTDDLDGRPGWSTTLRWSRPERGTVVATHYDNRGDRDLHRGEYAWRTRFDLLGLGLRLGPFDLAAEWMDGSTGMGERGGPRVQMDFSAAYALISWSGEFLRFSGRWDEFEASDRDGAVPGDPNDDDGHALTLAAFWESPDHPLRIGLEWMDLEGRRPAAGLAGFGVENGGESLRLEVRWYLDP
ncbi:MAG: hypothetical protein MI919_22890 [Holophagales bacterium]|nr:hypothetical protein [Holophagales bacterium]